MNTKMSLSIGERRRQIDKARMVKQKELMDEYDQTVYYPAKAELIKECEEEGHTHGKFHDNGLGWTWWWCGKCGTSWNKKNIMETEI